MQRLLLVILSLRAFCLTLNKVDGLPLVTLQITVTFPSSLALTGVDGSMLTSTFGGTVIRNTCVVFKLKMKFVLHFLKTYFSNKNKEEEIC